MGELSDKRFDLDDLLKDVSHLISPPEIIIRLRQALEAPHSSANSIAAIVTQDPNLSAQVLHLANSAMYGLPNRIDTVSRAISIIGTRALYHLALAVSATNTFSRLPCELVNVAVFWRHSIFTALVARSLAQRCHVLHPERLFVAGLLHDVGSLVLYSQYPETLREALMISQGNEQVLAEQEREILGFDHADVGGELLRIWGLPPVLQEAVERHHRPGAAHQARLEVSVVHLADALSNRTEQGSFSEYGGYACLVDPGIWTTLKLEEEDTDDIWDEITPQFLEILTVIVPRARA